MNSETVLTGTNGLTSITYGTRINPATGAMSPMKLKLSLSWSVALIAHEAVHEIQGWEDLHRRLAPDRRCFGFFHPALPCEPLIFVEVALTTGLAPPSSRFWPATGTKGPNASARK